MRPSFREPDKSRLGSLLQCLHRPLTPSARPPIADPTKFELARLEYEEKLVAYHKLKQHLNQNSAHFARLKEMLEQHKVLSLSLTLSLSAPISSFTV